MNKLTHQFVEHLPDQLEEGALYISIKFATVAHLCCCGCGNEVITPLSPTDWKLTYDGKSVSLYPSIGSWSLDCRSHYWIKHDKVKWAGSWSKQEIEECHVREAEQKAVYYEEEQPTVEQTETKISVTPERERPELLGRIKHALRSWFS
ncbi:DUF6527 family protein [Coraliomargarita sp. SDUM461003]|uniref:DUF6527 family protein n=1 Tax=Thalassobacterium maritimum TaxID=3041265 RepID=A0ABU1B006_9BACT|nr:DUF6527 family protein [Coraliomargarita sp. SDUM461003]MDQ8208824.1 DUF6527 family protein [Coraliomargarita sp. SDUM461003]